MAVVAAGAAVVVAAAASVAAVAVVAAGAAAVVAAAGAAVVPVSAPYMVSGVLAKIHMLIKRAVFLSPVTILFILHLDSFFYNSSYNFQYTFLLLNCLPFLSRIKA